jgi:hypothetical protein
MSADWVIAVATSLPMSSMPGSSAAAVSGNVSRHIPQADIECRLPRQKRGDSRLRILLNSAMRAFHDTLGIRLEFCVKSPD